MKSGEKKGVSLTTKMLVSLTLGVSTGLFFGERAAGLAVLGDAYVGLLQMTVLPFIAVSLVANIGRFSIAEGRSLASACIRILALLWALALLTVAVVPLAFPQFEVGSFFTTSLVEEPSEIDFLALYIPSNPFRSMAENMVPAVVLFSLLLGVALSTVERKQLLLEQLDVWVQGLVKVNGFAVSLAPYGVFAIAASAAGTISLSEFGRLQAYIVTHTLVSALLTFLVLPMLIAALTPLDYRSIVSGSKEFLLTAFITGSTFAVLPMIVEAIEEMTAETGMEQPEVHAAPGTLVALAYPFPTLGKLLALVFVPFAAWFVGTPMTASAYPTFLATGLVSSFGSLVVTIPFLLELIRVPADLFQLFLMSSVWSSRVSDLAGTMHIMAFAVLVLAIMTGRFKVRWAKLARLAAVTVLVGGGLIATLHAGIGTTLGQTYSKENVLASMQALEAQVPEEVLSEAAPNPIPLESGQTRLDRARQRGAIRIGFSPDRLPFSYFNAQGDLVGFDIDMAHHLANDIGVGIEFVPFERSTLRSQIEADHFDLAMSGVRSSLALIETADFSKPYLQVTWAFVVPGHRREEFATYESALAVPGVRWAVLADSYHEHRLRELFPGTEVTGLDREEEFFLAGESRYDVLVTSAQGGSAWTLVYPRYVVVTPFQASSGALVYPIADDSDQLAEFIDTWIDIQTANGTVRELFDYWILGRQPSGVERRWNILDDVLRAGR